MADAYGAIVVGFSEDFNGDKDSIAERLNSYNLSDSESAFIVDDGYIWAENGYSGVQYPTLTPVRDKIVVLMIDDKEVIKNANELSEQEIDEVYDVIEQEEVPLRDFAEGLSQHITSGSLYISCCSNEKQRNMISAYMEINADGSAKRVCISHCVGMPVRITEDIC